MKIENILRKNRSVKVGGSNIAFDQNGIADVDDVIGAQLLKLGGYCRPNKPPAAPAAKMTPAPAAADPDLESMSAAQLKKLAKDRGIDIGEASKKAELVELIQKTQA